MSEANAWRDVSTAPRDGTVIWVADESSMVVAYWAGQNEQCWRNWFAGTRIRGLNISVDAYLPIPIWFEPKFWQPLPTLPVGDDDQSRTIPAQSTAPRKENRLNSNGSPAPPAPV